MEPFQCTIKFARPIVEIENRAQITISSHTSKLGIKLLMWLMYLGNKSCNSTFHISTYSGVGLSTSLYSYSPSFFTFN